jgi:hypothetical protein
MIYVSLFVFSVATLALFLGDFLAATFDVIGIRIATLFVAFASFCSTSTFSFLVYLHNRTVSEINDDANRRAELFRELQFTSSNYSIIEFKDSMSLYSESHRYIGKYIRKENLRYHMVLSDIVVDELIANPTDYVFLTLKVPFVIVEGKTIAKVAFDKMRFDRADKSYYFTSPEESGETDAFVLYNENTKKNNAIINLVLDKNSDFFDKDKVNLFSKIKMFISITSLLGVEVGGITELYFTNPEMRELDGANIYQINSSNFKLLVGPKIVEKKVD